MDDITVSNTVPTKLIQVTLTFKPEKGLWVKADPTNNNTVRIGKSDISGTDGWPLVKGEEMLFDIGKVDQLYALAVSNNDVVHIFVR